MTFNELDLLADGVQTRKDFVEFLFALNKFYKESPEKFENNSLEYYLSGLAGFTNDIGGYFKNMKIDKNPEIITWNMLAHIFLAAIVYE